MSALKKDVILNIFTVDSVYEWVDDPLEGPVTILQQNNKEYIFSQESRQTFLKDFDSGFVDLPKTNLFIRNMVLDFDSHMFKVDFYLDGDYKNHDIEFKDM